MLILYGMCDKINLTKAVQLSDYDCDYVSTLVRYSTVSVWISQFQYQQSQTAITPYIFPKYEVVG